MSDTKERLLVSFCIFYIFIFIVELPNFWSTLCLEKIWYLICYYGACTVSTSTHYNNVIMHAIKKCERTLFMENLLPDIFYFKLFSLRCMAHELQWKNQMFLHNQPPKIVSAHQRGRNFWEIIRSYDPNIYIKIRFCWNSFQLANTDVLVLKS